MRSSFLSFSPPCISKEEAAEVADTLASDWITTGPKTKRFETEFQAFVGAQSALALNSCTAGLHAGLVTFGIGPGDEVITTPMTFCATANVVEHLGARVVLADVEPDTLCISPEKVAEVITPRTRCLLPVHYGGHPCDMDPLLELAEEHDIRVLEDAAHSFPARYKGRMIGTIGDLTAFSFYATKNLTTAEGGMLTGSPELIDAARVICLHGMSKDAWKRYDKGGSWYYEVVTPGFKYNMTDLQASLGVQQLKKLPGFQERRRQIVNRYRAAFAGAPYFELPAERSEVEHAWHLFVLRLNLETLTIDRAAFIEELRNRNIGTSVHFIPIHIHPFYRDKYGFKPEDFPVAFSNYLRMVSLPLNPRLTDQDVDDVIEAVLDVTQKFKR